jgi:uncharacterized membrane protein YgcG
MWIALLIGGVFLAGVGYKFRAVRVLVTIAALALIVLAPVVFVVVDEIVAIASRPSDSSTIKDYDLKYDLAKDGDLTLVETMDVSFSESRRGIFRFFDIEDSQDSGVQHEVVIKSVERCNSDAVCRDEPYTTYWEDGFYVAKIGEASVSYPPGTVNTYKIKTVTTNAITQVSGETDYQWFWDVIPGGWLMPINKVKVTASLPAEPVEPIECVSSTGDCTVSGTGDNQFSMTQKSLDPQSPTTWRATLPPQGLTAVPVSASSSFLDNVAVKALLVVIGLLLAAWLFLAIRKQKEPKPSQAPNFAEPSKDLLSAVWTLAEEPPTDAFQAMLLKLSELGVVTVQPEMSGETVNQKPEWFDATRTSEPVPPELTGADSLLSALGLTQMGAQVRIEKGSTSIGKLVQRAQSSLRSQSATGALRDKYATRSGAGMAIHALSALLPVLALLGVIATRSPYVGLLFALPAIAGWWSDQTLATSLTREGMRMRDQVSGLKVALSTKASVERFDYSLKARYFMQFLPWAVALDCAGDWAEACKPDDPAHEADPGYYMAMNYYYMSNAMSSTIASVSEGAIASYSASQSSSSGGGGGGFSAGGGSGGGGGGSW